MILLSSFCKTYHAKVVILLEAFAFFRQMFPTVITDLLVVKVADAWCYKIPTMALAYLFSGVFFSHIPCSAYLLDRYFLLPTPFSTYETFFGSPAFVAVFRAFLRVPFFGILVFAATSLVTTYIVPPPSQHARHSLMPSFAQAYDVWEKTSRILAYISECAYYAYWPSRAPRLGPWAPRSRQPRGLTF